jgi:hypothetical protein
MSNSIRRPEDGDNGTGLATKTRTRTKRPSLYRVLILNDDYTPMEFVVHVLERFFQKGRDEATRIMVWGSAGPILMKWPRQRSRRSWISHASISIRFNA